MPHVEFDLGMVGLGVMGSNLVQNMADHGFAVAGFDKDLQKVAALQAEAGGRRIRATGSTQEFVDILRKPRAVMLMVPAGPPVDAVIRDLLPYLESGDMLIDGGNSYFKDTNLRQKTLEGKGLLYLGVGISGGEQGARHGASIMPGGPKAAYERVKEILNAAAARVDGQPCAAYMGPGSAGHYVKMVHNGLEYGLMELIAECYDLMKRGLGMDDEAIQQVFTDWNSGELNSYLLEITANIFARIDTGSSQRLVDVILDEARQKGTGKWTSQEAMDLQVPAPTIDIAVSMRDMSTGKMLREQASQILPEPQRQIDGNKKAFLDDLQDAMYAGMILTFTQGMALLGKASIEYQYNLDLKTIARIWRGGCIIRAALLEPIAAAYEAQPDLPNLMFNERLGPGETGRCIPALRDVVAAAARAAVPVPGLMASLGYYDSLSSAWLPANLIQAQRDYFGAHTYERVDGQGVFHTQWEKG